MLTGRWFVEHDQRCCVTRAPDSVDGPVNTLTSAVVCLYRAERGWGGARGASGLGTRLETPLGRHGSVEEGKRSTADQTLMPAN